MSIFIVIIFVALFVFSILFFSVVYYCLINNYFNINYIKLIHTYNIDRRQYKWSIPVNICYLAS